MEEKNNVKQKSKIYKIVCAAAAAACGIFSPQLIIVEAVLPVLVAFAGWILTFYVRYMAQGKVRAFAIVDFVILLLNGAFTTAMFYGLTRDPKNKLMIAALPFVFLVIIPTIIYIVIAIASRKSKNKTENNQ